MDLDDSGKQTRCEIGWYPCLKLLDLLKACINKTVQDLDIVLGDKANKGKYVQSSPVKAILEPLLKREAAVLARMAFWQQQAEACAKKGEVFCVSPDCKIAKGWSLIWQEADWKPETAHTSLEKAYAYNPHSATLVETWHGKQCRFIRDSWLLDEEKSLGNAKRCDLATDDVDALDARPTKKEETDKEEESKRTATSTVSAGPENTSEATTQLQQQLAGFIGKGNIKVPAAKWNPQVSRQVGEIFWRLQSHPDHPDKPFYDVSGAAQFFRFTGGASLNTSDTIGLGDVMKKQLNLGGFSLNGELDLAHATCHGEFILPGLEGWQCSFGYETTDDNELHTWHFGALQLQGHATLYGLAGATVKLSANLRFASNDNQLGLSGDMPVTTDFVSSQFGKMPVIHGTYDDDTSAQQTGIQGGVDLFAGVEAGGMVKLGLNWLPPGKGKDWVTLCSVSAGGAFAAGVGEDVKFLVSLRGGKLVFMASSELVAGPGFKGSVGFMVDPKAMSQFVEAMAKVTAQNNYRCVTFINSLKTGGEASEDAYQYLNELLTAYFTTALSLVELALMPLTLLAEANQKLLDKKYALLLAQNINRHKPELWFDNTFPEVKGRLLYCLMQYPDLSGYWYEGHDYQQDVSINMQQRDAALNLITWLSQESHEAGSKQYRLMLMGCNPQGKKPDEEFEKFQAYGDTWGALQAWFYFLYFHKLDTKVTSQLDKLIGHHHNLCPELNKHYNLYEYTTVAGVTRRWVYMGDVTPPMTLKQRLSRMGITYITPTLLKEGM